MPRRVEAGELIEGVRQLELASFPTNKEWNYWWRVRSRDCEMTYAWERALIDAITRLVRNNFTLSRMMRLEGEAKKVIRYDSDGQIHGEEMISPAELTREALAWFLQVIKPAQKDAPEWAELLFKGVEGCYIQQARFGLELTGIKKRGYLTLNHSAAAPNPQAFNEIGTETL